MIKKTAVFLTLTFISLVQAHAGFQFDLSKALPFVHLAVDSEGAEFMPPERSGLKFLLVYQDTTIHYYFQVGPFRMGPGIRLSGFILLNYIYPVLSMEWDIGKWCFRLQAGGGAILEAGYFCFAFMAGMILIPELSVARKLVDGLSLGMSAAWPFWFLGDEYNGSPMAFIDFEDARDGIKQYEQNSVFLISFFVRVTLPVK